MSGFSSKLRTSSLSAEDPTKSMKTQATDWGEIFVNHTTDKRLASRIYKELSKYNITKFK